MCQKYLVAGGLCCGIISATLMRLFITLFSEFLYFVIYHSRVNFTDNKEPNIHCNTFIHNIFTGDAHSLFRFTLGSAMRGHICDFCQSLPFMSTYVDFKIVMYVGNCCTKSENKSQFGGPPPPPPHKNKRKIKQSKMKKTQKKC